MVDNLWLRDIIFQERSRLCEPYKLQQTPVVIEFNNVLEKYFYSANINFTSLQYGGDYQNYADHVKMFFQKLKICGVRPIVVYCINGCPAKRGDRLKYAKYISETGKPHKLMPHMFFDMCVGVLRELEVEIYIEDTVGGLVSLANYLRCPVIACDNIFYLLGIDKGFIWFDDIIPTLVINEEKNKYLKCSKYDRYKLEVNPSEDTLLSLFLVVELFGYLIPHFLRNIGDNNDEEEIPQNDENLAEVAPEVIEIFNPGDPDDLDLLYTVLSTMSKEEVINEILENAPIRRGINFLNIINSFFKRFESNESRIKPYLENEENIQETEPFTSMPSWLSKMFRHRQLAPLVLFTITRQSLYLCPMINDPISHSSHACSLRIRMALYHILAPLIESENIREIDRNIEWQEEAQLTKIKYRATDPALTKITITNLMKQSQDKKLRFLLDALKCPYDFLIGIHAPSYLKLPVLLLKYVWIRSSLIRCRDTFEAILASILILSYEAPITDTAQFYLDKRPIVRREGNHFEADIVHRYSEYQSCWKNVMYLNQLLGEPLELPAIGRCLSGTLIYNLTTLLRHENTWRMKKVFMGKVLGSKREELFYNLMRKITTS